MLKVNNKDTRTKPLTLVQVTVLHVCFLRLLSLTNSAKSRKGSHIQVHLNTSYVTK